MTAQSVPARRRSTTAGRSAAAGASVLRSRTTALISSTPVTPLPIAASVKATSTAKRRTQTSDSSSP